MEVHKHVQVIRWWLLVPLVQEQSTLTTFMGFIMTHDYLNKVGAPCKCGGFLIKEHLQYVNRGGTPLTVRPPSTWLTSRWTPHEVVRHESSMGCHMLCTVSCNKTAFADFSLARFCLFAAMCGLLVGFLFGSSVCSKPSALPMCFICHGWTDVRHCFLARIHGWNRVSVVLVVFRLLLLLSLHRRWFRVSSVVV